VGATYNLYLVDPAPNLEAPIIIPSSKNVSNLQTTLQGLLKSPEFLPDGGRLGFGLAHLYPMTFETELQEMTTYLKGADADVYRACREVQLQPSLRMIYDEDLYSELGTMLDYITEVDYHPHYETYREALGGVTVNTIEMEPAELDDYHWVKQGNYAEFIAWISPPSKRNQLQDISVALGKCVSTELIYCCPCLIVDIPAAGDRM